VWAGDLTYIQTGEGWLYLTIVLDLFNREIVGWSIQHRARSQSLPSSSSRRGLL